MCNIIMNHITLWGLQQAYAMIMIISGTRSMRGLNYGKWYKIQRQITWYRNAALIWLQSVPGKSAWCLRARKLPDRSRQTYTCIRTDTNTKRHMRAEAAMVPTQSSQAEIDRLVYYLHTRNHFVTSGNQLKIEHQN